MQINLHYCLQYCFLLVKMHYGLTEIFIPNQFALVLTQIHNSLDVNLDSDSDLIFIDMILLY